MATNLTQTNTIYDIYGRTINGKDIIKDGSSVPRVATTAECDAGTGSDTAVSPNSAATLGYQSFYKTHGIFYGFSGSYGASSTNLNITNGSKWYTSSITEQSASIARVSSLNKRSTYLITGMIQFNLGTTGQIFNLDLQNANTGVSDPIIRSGVVATTSVAGLTTYYSILSGVVDVNNGIVDVTIRITSINLNGGGSVLVSTNSHLTITEL